MSAPGSKPSSSDGPFFKSFEATSVGFQTCARRMAARRAFGDSFENDGLSAAPDAAGDWERRRMATTGNQAEKDCIRTLSHSAKTRPTFALMPPRELRWASHRVESYG